MKPETQFALAFALAAALAACQPAAQAPVAEDASVTEAVPPANPAATPVETTDRVIVDGRDFASWPEQIDEAEESALLSVIDGTGATSGDTIETVWDGAFTQAGASQRAVLVAHDGGPASIVPFPTPSTLVVLEDGKVVAKLDLPKDDAGYQWIVGVADVGADGVDELLLRSAYVQMGESGSSFKVVSLEDGQYEPGQAFKNASHNDCSAPYADDPKVEASVISLQAGELVARRYEAACAAPVAEQAMTPDPKPEDFVPVDEDGV